MTSHLSKFNFRANALLSRPVNTCSECPSQLSCCIQKYAQTSLYTKVSEAWALCHSISFILLPFLSRYM
ncbi:hypothetical protein K1719_025549 [Acacia pycnantha]|nr:hypothetical protein K1719_040464 [Acacia pycnantha]KAI9097778.1 hypothetical protein K1719_025549 [Acacia pycnantha]